MFASYRIIAAFVISLFLASCAHHQKHESTPSEGAKDIAGAKGTFEFKPADWKESETSFWKDSDGVKPGVAGCHIGTDESGTPNGRMFGEACLANGLLVESNPGQMKCIATKMMSGIRTPLIAMRGVSRPANHPANAKSPWRRPAKLQLCAPASKCALNGHSEIGMINPGFPNPPRC